MNSREVQEQADIIRELIRREGGYTHHPNCNSRDGKPCDCYAQLPNKADDALEELLAEIDRRNP